MSNPPNLQLPESLTFQADWDGDAPVQLSGVPDDPALRQALTLTLAQLQPSGAAWRERYQTYQGLLPGLPEALPRYRRAHGRLDRELLTVERVEVSADGETWLPFPATPPQVQVTHWQEGRIDIDPDPPEDLLDALEDAARAWHGEREADWAAAHARLAPGTPIPQARRTLFELTPDGPRALSAHAAHSADGETWTPYDPQDGGEGGDADVTIPGLGGLNDLLEQMLDVATVPVTVYADGRVEWEEGAIPDEHAGRIRADLREATGAGEPDDWVEWTRALLSETFADELPEDADIPAPQAVRLDLPKDALDDPDPLAQTFMESEVSFDGETWHDLYGEELPPELAARPAESGPRELN